MQKKGINQQIKRHWFHNKFKKGGEIIMEKEELKNISLSDDELIAEARKKYYKEYRETHKKQISDYEKKYHEENPEKRKQYARQTWLNKAKAGYVRVNEA